MLVALTLLPLALAGSVTETWGDLSVALEAPDAIEPGQPFTLTLHGKNATSGSFGVYAWALYQDTSWTYNSNHMVSATGGTLLEASGFGWGDTLARTRTLALPEGEYTFTLVFGERSFAHGWYDVAVDLTVTVASEPTLCDLAWLPPMSTTARSGRTLPLRFEAWDCATGAFAADPGVVVSVLDAWGAEVDGWSFTGELRTGIVIKDGRYQVLWRTPQPGDYTLLATFSTGETLERTVSVR